MSVIALKIGKKLNEVKEKQYNTSKKIEANLPEVKKKLRKKYANSNEFIIKIRNENDYEDKVYYNGIKCFSIDKLGNKSITDNILKFNKSTIEKLHNNNLRDDKIIEAINENRKHLNTYEITKTSSIDLIIAPKSFKEDNNILSLIKKDLELYGLGELSFINNFDFITKKYIEQCKIWRNQLEIEKVKNEHIFNENEKFIERLEFNDYDIELINNIKNIKRNIVEIIEFIFTKRCIFHDNYEYYRDNGFGKPKFNFLSNMVIKSNNYKFDDILKTTIDEYIKNGIILTKQPENSPIFYK